MCTKRVKHDQCLYNNVHACAQIKHWGPGGEEGGEGLQPGDVLASNHPQLAGGSHLPDITIITPVFNGGEIRFFVASRGHHADVGGITPGSMPPNSHSLAEEGAAILSFKLVRSGVFQVLHSPALHTALVQSKLLHSIFGFGCCSRAASFAAGP